MRKFGAHVDKSPAEVRSQESDQDRRSKVLRFVCACPDGMARMVGKNARARSILIHFG